MYQLDAETINQLMRYLSTKPYVEVYELIEKLKNVKPIKQGD